MSKNAPDTFVGPWLILCEGKGDEHFLTLLLAHKNIQDFQIISPQRDLGGGRQAFGRYLLSVSTNEDFVSKVRGLLVITDNDDAAAFSEMKVELAKAGMAVPPAPGVIATGTPPLAVYLWPHNTEGNLEALCLGPAYSKWPVREAVDAFVQATPAAGWSVGKQAKVRMQAIIAANNEKHPDTGFSASWTKKPEHRIPIDHADFDPVATFIRSFPTLAAAG